MPSENQTRYRTEFLKSEFWQNLRLENLAGADAKCRVCSKRDVSNDVHHVYYPPSWYDVTAEMLIVLCRDCHTLMHLLTEPSKARDLESGREWLHAAVVKMHELLAWKVSAQALYGKQREVKLPVVFSGKDRLSRNINIFDPSCCLMCRSKSDDVSRIDMSGVDRPNMTWSLCPACWYFIDTNAGYAPDGERYFQQIRPVVKLMQKFRIHPEAQAA